MIRTTSTPRMTKAKRMMAFVLMLRRLSALPYALMGDGGHAAFSVITATLLGVGHWLATT